MYVPLVTGKPGVSVGNGFAAASSSKSVTLLIPVQQPPASDMIMEVCPPGPIKSMSRSGALGWVMLFSFTVTFVITPGIPATTILDG